MLFVASNQLDSDRGFADNARSRIAAPHRSRPKLSIRPTEHFDASQIGNLLLVPFCFQSEAGADFFLKILPGVKN
jgi:hypothetical protein